MTNFVNVTHCYSDCLKRIFYVNIIKREHNWYSFLQCDIYEANYFNVLYVYILNIGESNLNKVTIRSRLNKRKNFVRKGEIISLLIEYYATVCIKN